MVSRAIRRPRRVQGRVLTIIGYVVFAWFVLFPVLWVFLMSVKEFRDIIAYPPKFVFTPTLRNYAAILFGTESPGQTTGMSDYPRYLFNSIVISGGAVLLAAVIGVPAAYALTRSHIRGRSQIAFTFLSFRFAPELAVILPLFIIYKQLRLYDTFPGLILANLLVALPIVIWTMIAFFKEVPLELEEAARLDGANAWQVVARVAIPIVRPGIASALIIAFISSWNNLIFGLVLAGEHTQPVTLGILKTMNFEQIKWGWMAAASVIAAMPGMLVAIYLQRHLVRGLTMGAVK